MSTRHLPNGLDDVTPSPVPGLAVYSRRVANPVATLITIHGGLDRGGSFARLARRLPHVDLVTYDRRGYQGSRGLTPLGLTPAIDDLLVLITAEAPQPVLLFGHSYGGTIATGAAARQPDAVAGVLVYEAPLPWVLSRTVGGDVSDDGPSEAEGFFRRMVGNSAWERLSESDKVSRRADGDGLVADLRSIRGNPPAPYRVEEVAAPYVYAYGDQHAAAYFEELAEELHRRNPLMSGRLLAGAPHGAHLAAPDHIATLITELETTCALA